MFCVSSVLMPTTPPPRSPPSRPSFSTDRKSTRLNSSYVEISYAVFCLKKKNYSTGRHSQQVADLVLRLTRALGLPPSEAQMIALAGRLHDVVKVAIPDGVLKKAGHLTEEEWELMRTHPQVGAEVVSHIPALRPLAPVIRAHHERWDGQGYPDHLKVQSIPFGART